MRLSNKITAVDAHACGEPGRVITGGVSDVPGDTMFEKKAYLQRHADGLRKLMLREPRGYPAMCCNVILPPTNPEADAGFVIMEQTEYPAMSGTIRSSPSRTSRRSPPTSMRSSKCPH